MTNGASPATRVYDPPKPLPDVALANGDKTRYDRAMDWFTERGITTHSIIARRDIAVVEEKCMACDAMRTHILFPYYRDGVHVNTKHRCSAKHFRMERGAERIFYGLDDIADDDETVIIVEGEIDKLSLAMAGMTNCLSVPDGAPTPESKNYANKFTFLDSAEDLFDRVNRVVLAVDNDAPGKALEAELSRRIGPDKCLRVNWPDGCKDANDVLVQHGWEALARCIRDADPFPVEGVFTMRDIESEIDTAYERGWDEGPRFGYPVFDQYYRPRPGLFTVLTGIPSHGKSHFLDQLLIHLADRQGWNFGMCSPENQPLARHASGLIRTYIGKPFHRYADGRMDPDDLARGKAWLDEHFTFVLPESPTVDAILDRARSLVFRKGITGLVVDPWNELEYSRPSNMTEPEYISQVLSKFRRFARTHNVHVWLVAHPTKLKQDPDSDEEPMASLYDISGAAHWRNKCDFGLCVWRNIKYPEDPVRVSILKVRFDETGQTGRVDFTYDKRTGRYTEYSTA